jgi:hypothetical protein
MPLVKINSGAIQDSTIIVDDLANASVNGPKLGIYSVSGNNIANNAISSNTLAANLSFSLVRVLETANVYTTAIGGNVNIDVSNNSVYFFTANTTANVTFNIRANATSSFDGATNIGQTTSVAMLLRHGTTRHTANLYVDNVLQTLYYAANSRPTGGVTIANSEYNLITFTVFKTGVAAYTVLTSNTLFALG